MNYLTRQYLFGAVFTGVAIYQGIRADYWQAAFYGVAGLAFIVNALGKEPRLAAYKLPLVIASWTLILGAAVLFIYVLRYWL